MKKIALRNELVIPPDPLLDVGADTMPRYRVVYTYLRDLITSQIDSVGKTLPIEKRIASHFDVSKITIRQALDLLEQDGFIKKIHSKPAVVIARTPAIANSRRITTVDDLMRNELNLRVSVVGWEKTTYPFASSLFELSERIPLHTLSLRQFNDIGQVGYSEIYFSPEIGEKLSQEFFEASLKGERARVFKMVESECGIRTERTQVTLSAISDQRISEKIGIDPLRPIVCMQMIFWASNRIFQITNNWFDGLYYKVSYDLSS